MQISKLIDASLDFSTILIRLVEDLMSQQESIMSPQLAKSGTMIGAYIHEAQFAPNKAEYVAKLQKALDETSQTADWL
ncbi:MAG: four helix bundle protein, partial [Clostridia bacterium]|nr:four helix bundle protein [Clostridia bacterium]